MIKNACQARDCVELLISTMNAKLLLKLIMAINTLTSGLLKRIMVPKHFKGFVLI